MPVLGHSVYLHWLDATVVDVAGIQIPFINKTSKCDDVVGEYGDGEDRDSSPHSEQEDAEFFFHTIPFG